MKLKALAFIAAVVVPTFGFAEESCPAESMNDLVGKLGLIPGVEGARYAVRSNGWSIKGNRTNGMTGQFMSSWDDPWTSQFPSVSRWIFKYRESGYGSRKTLIISGYGDHLDCLKEFAEGLYGALDRPDQSEIRNFIANKSLRLSVQIEHETGKKIAISRDNSMLSFSGGPEGTIVTVGAYDDITATDGTPLQKGGSFLQIETTE